MPNESHEELLAWARVQSLAEEFDVGRNPILAIEAFIIAVRARIYPPESIMDWLANRLNNWYESGGEVTLEEALKLIGGSRGTPLTRRQRVRRNDNAFELIDKLRAWGATVEQAALMVEGLATAQGELRGLKQATLIDVYKKRRMSRETRTEIAALFKRTPMDVRRKFLRRIPEGYVTGPLLTLRRG